MSNLIDFQQLGGYRLEQPTFEKMQSTYYLILKGMIGHFGIPDNGNFIISGCTIDGAIITAGIVYIDGTICEFATAPGTLASKIKKSVTMQTLAFQNGTTPTVFQKFTAIVDASGTALSDFIRVPSPFNLPLGTVIDSNYLAFTQAMLDKLNGIETNAEKNVQADWNETNAQSDAFLKNKPPGNLMTYLIKSQVVIGNISGGADDVVTVTFPTPLANANYMVLCEFVSRSAAGPAFDNDFTYVISGKTTTQFKITFSELYQHNQNIEMNYYIIPL